ncbi:MAG: phage tail tape measure protein [Zoogloeaceae bacterium]|nr:phage tail tape measure protein [Zoogloeaceae bacterium]
MANLVTKIIISATDQASNVFDAIQRNAGKLATAVAGYFGFKFFNASIDSAREFEAAMSRVGAASGATGDELAALKAAAEEAGASTAFTSVEAANALENLAKAGLSASDAVATLPAVLDLAIAGGVDLATSSDYISKAVAGMGLSFQDAGRVADVLAKGANASNTSVDGLANALSYAAPLANSLGLSLEQTVAIIGKFADAGIDASRAGTALNSILAQFSNPASTFRRELASAGIITGDFDQALRQLAAAGPAGQKAILAVGQEAVPALRALLNQGIGSLDDLKAKLDDAAGSAKTFAGVMSNNLDGASKGLASAWEALKIKLGEPILGPLKEQLNALATGLREFVSNGTATQFGQSIAEAFKAGAEWVRGFIAEIDFSAVYARMQAFAADSKAFFENIGAEATKAAAFLKTAQGVMSGGFNLVLAGIYKAGEGMAWLTSAILAEVAIIANGLSKITFGDLSDSFAAAASSIRAEAQAAYAVMEVFGKKSEAAFDAATDAANDAKEGFAAVTAPIESANKALEKTTTIVGMSADSLETLGNNAEVAGGKLVNMATQVEEVGKKATASGAAQSAAADAARAKVAELRAEYARLIEAGDTQGAAKVLVQLQAELDKTKAKAAETAEAVDAAFERLGVTSTAALKKAAEAAKRDFEIIKASGTATAADIGAAFSAYAEKAIEANAGVATQALKAQAAQNGMKIEADEAGKVIVRSMKEAREATAEIATAAQSAEAGMSSLGKAAAGAAAEGRSLAETWDEAGNMISEGMDRSVSAGRDAGTLVGLYSEQQIQAIKTIDFALQEHTRNIMRNHNERIIAAGAEARALDRLADQQNRLSSSAARGVDDLKLRLIELSGTEDEIAKARLERDKADIARQIALVELEIKHAMVRGESGEAPRLREEIKLLQEQLVLIDKVFKAEQRNAKSKEGGGSRGSSGGGSGGSSGGSSSSSSSSAKPSGPSKEPPLRTVNVNLNIGGASIPVTAAESDATRLIRELEALERVSA